MANSTLDSNIVSPHLDLISHLFQDKKDYIFVKNQQSIYQYANLNFLTAMGLNSLSDIYNLSDYELCKDKNKVKIFLQHDAEVLETEKVLSVEEELFLYNGIVKKTMKGKIYPLYYKSSKPIAVIGIVKPKYHPIKLTLEEALLLNFQETEKILLKRSYSVKVFNRHISLSKREIQCIIQLLKGKHAGEIASSFNLKQATIEFYIDNIKNKLGAINKSSLIHTVIHEKIIQQIFL